MREEKTEQQNTQEEKKRFSSIKEMMDCNQKKIIEDKERFYDRVIDSLHLTPLILDIVIIVLILAIVLIIVLNGKNL